jgi:hypothetical protein
MIHILKHGQPLCDFMPGKIPMHWPEGHKWVSFEDTKNLRHADCHGCREAQKLPRIQGLAIEVLYAPEPVTEEAMNKYTICIDFDGVIHQYTTKWADALTISDPPMPGAFEFLTTMVRHFVVVIHTSRLKQLNEDPHFDDPFPPQDQERVLEVKRAMRAWFRKHGLDEDVMNQLVFWTMPGKPTGLIYLDDRAVRFEGRFPTKDEIHQALRPWKFGETPEPQFFNGDELGVYIQQVVDAELGHLQLVLEEKIDRDPKDSDIESAYLDGRKDAVGFVEDHRGGSFKSKLESIEKQLEAMLSTLNSEEYTFTPRHEEKGAVTDPDLREVVTLRWVLKVLRGQA